MAKNTFLEEVKLIKVKLIHLSAWEANNCAVINAIVFQLFWIDAFWVEDCTIVLNNTDAGSSCSCQVTACVETDITESLHDEGLKE